MPKIICTSCESENVIPIASFRNEHICGKCGWNFWATCFTCFNETCTNEEQHSDFICEKWTPTMTIKSKGEK